MQRLIIEPRKDWELKVKSLGLEYYDQAADGIYWNESAYYSFSKAEIDKMYYASKELFSLCMQAIDKIIENDWFARFGIARPVAQAIVDSWDDDAPTLYGRFDLTVGADGNFKMMEFNADTPTSLFEASIIQWAWKQEQFIRDDQYNSIHDTLLEQFKYIRTRLPKNYGELYFTSVTSPEEDIINTRYIMAAGREAGLNTRYIPIDDIGFDSQNFVDEENYIIKHMFKLYPWEWLLNEQYAPHIGQIDTWIEPLWKLLLSSKAILPILWELFPNHPNLLPAYFSTDTAGVAKLNNKIVKPFFSREGCNILVKQTGQEDIATDGMYGDLPTIEQEFCPLPLNDGKYACLGSWIVGDEPCGLGIRESENLITRNESKFVPHVIRD